LSENSLYVGTVVTVLSQFCTLTVCNAISRTKPSALDCGISIQSPMRSMSLDVSWVLATSDSSMSLNTSNSTADRAPSPEIIHSGERSSRMDSTSTVQIATRISLLIWIYPLMDRVCARVVAEYVSCQALSTPLTAMKIHIHAPAWASRPTVATARSACGTSPIPSDTTAKGTAYQKFWYARRRRKALSQSSRPVSSSSRCAQASTMRAPTHCAISAARIRAPIPTRVCAHGWVGTYSPSRTTNFSQCIATSRLPVYGVARIIQHVAATAADGRPLLRTRRLHALYNRAIMAKTPQPDQNQFANKAQAWSARFSEPVSELVKRYTASVDFDKRLARYDIQGSLAHADMLAAQGIIPAQDLADIQRGMAQILDEIEAGSFQWLLDLEDVHLNIEKRLVELVGDAGKRLHTGRSRNDQVATDIRLWLRAEIDNLLDLLRQLRHALATVALENAATIMPGFTHLQVAQPVTFGHHLLAYAEMF